MFIAYKQWDAPWERENIGPEMALLGRAIKARLVNAGDEGLPAWAENVLSAFEAENPTFDRYTGLTAEWAEEEAAFNAASKEAALKKHEEKVSSRAAAIEAACKSEDWEALVSLRVESVELPERAIKARMRLVWGRGDKAVGVVK